MFTKSAVVGIALSVCLCVSPKARAGAIFWANDATWQVQTSEWDGSKIETIHQDAIGGMHGLTIDTFAGKLYSAYQGGIRRMNLDGSGLEVIYPYSQGGWAREIELDQAAGKMYWSDSLEAHICRADLDGGNVETLYTTTGSGLRGMALDPAGNRMYWLDVSVGELRSADLDGGDVQTVVSGLGNTVGLDIDLLNGKLYWGDSTIDKVLRANLDGSQLEDVIVGINTPFAVDVVPERGELYWTDSFNGLIRRADLDGGNPTTVVTGIERPFGLAVIPEPASVALFALGLAFVSRRR